MLYGKWRPRRFAEVAGQDHIVTTLKNAVATGQVAHAYLFTGPRGTGKTTSARILAKAVNCANPQQGDPCNECPSCEAINRGAALDLVEMDAASNRGIDDIRELRERIAYSPSDLKKKVYLLDEAHQLTQQAFNALLKTLEEPPPHAIIILATTEAHGMPPTIVSRCQRFDFRRGDDKDVVGRLAFIAEQEGFQVPEEGLRQIAKVAHGGFRDAITLLEQVVAQHGPSPSTEEVEESLGVTRDERTERLADAILEGDLQTALGIARDVADGGVEFQRFTRNTIDVLRDRVAAVLQTAEKPVNADVLPLLRAIDALASADFKRDPGSPVPLEVAIGTAILGPASAPAMSMAAPSSPAAGAAPAAKRPSGPPTRAANGGARTPEPAAANSREEAFLQRLMADCRSVDGKVAALLNGSCEVISLENDAVTLGFYHEFHLQQVENKGRVVIEESAARILGHPISLIVKQVERSAPAKRGPKGGHLVAAARSIEGATPVAKEG